MNAVTYRKEKSPSAVTGLSRFMTPSWLGGKRSAKITVSVWDFDPLGTAMTPLQRGGFPTLPLLHSTESKAIKEGTTSLNANYKSSHVASNFMVICIMLIRRVCMHLMYVS